MNRLIYAASSDNADLFYASGFLAVDPFLYFEKAGRSYIALNALEYDRGQKEARVHHIINQSTFTEKLRKPGKANSHWIAELLKQHRPGPLTVAPTFPVGLWNKLRQCGIKLVVSENQLFPERVSKNKAELKHIRNSLKVTAQLLKVATDLIHASRPKGGKHRGSLMLHGKPLTSEKVQSAIRMEAARLGFSAEHPIVAGGIQGCDPHERGHGTLRANELIVIDIFPRDLKTGYWGDMTRTVVKGRASEAQRKQHHTVAKGQKLALQKLHAGIDGKSVHSAVSNFFEEQGYKTGNTSGRYEGFFHGTGHGLGLEIHETPRVSAVSQILKKGSVVTVEPGLYYPATGGVRIEDVVVLEKSGCNLLSHFSVPLEI